MLKIFVPLQLESWWIRRQSNQTWSETRAQRCIWSSRTCKPLSDFLFTLFFLCSHLHDSWIEKLHLLFFWLYYFFRPFFRFHIWFMSFVVSSFGYFLSQIAFVAFNFFFAFLYFNFGFSVLFFCTFSFLHINIFQNENTKINCLSCFYSTFLYIFLIRKCFKYYFNSNSKVTFIRFCFFNSNPKIVLHIFVPIAI